MRRNYQYGALVLLLAALISGGLGCNLNQAPTPVSPETSPSTPTSPAYPTAPAMQLVLASPSGSLSPVERAGFSARSGSSDGFGVYHDGRSIFQFQVPAGDYLLSYSTTLGDFYIVFRAKNNALIGVGIQEGDLVYEAKLYRGTATGTTVYYENDVVRVFSVFGAREGWHLFQRDESLPEILLIGGIGVTYIPGVSLELVLPRPALYILEYRTNLATYRVEFQTTQWFEHKVIRLQPGESISEAYITVL